MHWTFPSYFWCWKLIFRVLNFSQSCWYRERRLIQKSSMLMTLHCLLSIVYFQQWNKWIINSSIIFFTLLVIFWDHPFICDPTATSLSVLLSPFPLAAFPITSSQFMPIYSDVASCGWDIKDSNINCVVLVFLGLSFLHASVLMCYHL